MRRTITVSVATVVAIVMTGTLFFVLDPDPPGRPTTPTESTAPGSELPVCIGDQPVAQCLTEWSLRNIDNLSAVLDVLTDRTVSDAAFFSGGCHETWHAVGEEAGRRYELSSAISAWAYSCYGGFLHGAMSTAVPLMGVEEFKSIAPSICATFADRPNVVPLDCWHGVGHGFASVLPFPTSMEACVGVAIAEDELAWCTWGAAETLGEQFITEPGVRATIESTLDGLCEDLSVGQQACIRIAAPMLQVSGRSVESIYQYCASQSDPLRSWCAFSAGQLFATQWLDGSDAIKCNLIPSLESHCAAGAGRNVGRTDEWGTLNGSSRKVAGVQLSVCPEFTQPARSACEEAESAVRELELSPEESGTLTRTWWDAGRPPIVVLERTSQYREGITGS